MEDFTQGENVLLDFNDVFGGPPRQFSMREMRGRYGFSEPVGSVEDQFSSPRRGVNEKVVFGEDRAAKRRNPSGDFFDDIFKGEESYISPRSKDRDADSMLGSSPRLSPSAKLTKAMEYPTFSSPNHGQDAEGQNCPHSSSASLSRFSSQTNRGQDEKGINFYPFYPQSPLSREASISSDNSPSTKENIENLKNENPVDGNDFHFSIYKWAGGGTPMLMPLVELYSFKSMSKNIKCASFNGKTYDDYVERKSPEFSKKERDENDYRSNEVQNTIEEAFCDMLESKSGKNKEDTDVLGGFRENIKAEEIKSLDEIDTKKKVEKEIRLKMEESIKPEVKPEMKETRIDANTNTESGVKGKVKDFVQIFNQESDSRLKFDVPKRSQSHRWKSVGVDQKDNEIGLNAAKVNLHNVDKKPDVSLKVDENLEKDEGKLSSQIKTPSFRQSFRKDSEISVDESDDPFEDYFMVEELSHDQETITQSSEGSEEIKALDAKILQWSVGKKGNIRSLLSTLQSVLWPGSGWQPVPLVDLIESNSVKRAYQKALLRIHPDKLQQKSAASHQKYIAEKVFDILQEAWDHFNTLDTL